MAQQVVVNLTDDLDGSVAAETVAFALDGVSFEIDLNAKNAAALRKALGRYVAAGRKTTTPRRAGGRGITTRGRGTSTVDAKAVRAWAAKKKIALSPRGRIPRDIVEQYLAATTR
jgi:hypothetical protein